MKVFKFLEDEKINFGQQELKNSMIEILFQYWKIVFDSFTKANFNEI